MARVLPVLFACASLSAAAAAQPADDLGRWHAGPYSYSDELGGFAIVGISGSGRTADDPVVLVQEFHSASPVTLDVGGVAAAVELEDGVGEGGITSADPQTIRVTVQDGTNRCAQTLTLEAI